MDIRCRKCGEPWDIDSLHEQVDPEEGRVNGRDLGYGLVFRTYEQARKAFNKQGCELFGTSHGMLLNGEGQNVLAELQDLCGDDIEFLASATEDAESFGLL